MSGVRSTPGAAATAAARLRRLRDDLRRWRSRRDAPRPALATIDIGPSVPGWSLHLALAVCVVGSFLAAAAGTAVATGLLVLVLTGLAVAVAAHVRSPGYVLAAVSLTVTTLAHLAVDPVGYSWRVPVLLLTVHATVRLSWFTTRVGLRTRVERRVLVGEGLRSGLFNAVGQVVALLGGLLTAVAQEGDGGVPGAVWFGLLGAVCLLVLAVALRRGLARSAAVEELGG